MPSFYIIIIIIIIIIFIYSPKIPESSMDFTHVIQISQST